MSFGKEALSSAGAEDGIKREAMCKEVTIKGFKFN